MSTARQIVDDWHSYLNTRDLDALTVLLATDVEMSGPRGSARGNDLVREWVERSGIRLDPRRTYQRGDAVVVEQAAHWPDPDDEQVRESLTEPRTVFTAFQVEQGRISRILRFDALAPALEVSGLTEQDLVA